MGNGPVCEIGPVCGTQGLAQFVSPTCLRAEIIRYYINPSFTIYTYIYKWDIKGLNLISITHITGTPEQAI